MSENEQRELLGTCNDPYHDHTAEQFWSEWIGISRGRTHVHRPFTIQLDRAWKFAEDFRDKSEAELLERYDQLAKRADDLKEENKGLREEIERLKAEPSTVELMAILRRLGFDENGVCLDCEHDACDCAPTELRAKLAEQGKPTPDGGALVNTTAQQEEWIAAIEQAECQIESFAPLTLTNIKALRAEAEAAALRESREKCLRLLRNYANGAISHERFRRDTETLLAEALSAAPERGKETK